MKIENASGPAIVKTLGTNVTPSGRSAREAAIAKFMGEQTNQVAQQTVSEQPSVSQEAQTLPIESAAPVEAKAETRAPDKQLSSEYAILAKKEKAIRQREQQLRAKEAELKAAETAKAQPQKPALDESKYVPKEKLLENPFSVLGELGLSYEQLTEMAMNAPKPEQIAMLNEIKALRNELNSLKTDNESTKKTFEEQQSEYTKQAMQQYKYETQQLVNSSNEFELIKETRSIPDVVELIERKFNSDGILLTVEEAARLVESHLEDEAIKIARLSKVQRKLQPSQTAQKATGTPQQQPQKTLTNSVGSTRKLSAKERAILAFKGELK